jgi:hypothetical protein
LIGTAQAAARWWSIRILGNVLLQSADDLLEVGLTYCPDCN